ncbi:ABC transporter permease [Nocardia higoensis]|uniref:ABC transporter permease n=1 Tax=Nocardia higoensis TaxID=228599 RepID=UPI0003151881|nr:ABC transporter permease [Nocardia higoensis]
MWRYVARRAAQAVVVLWAAYTVSFFILFYLPGDSVDAAVGASATAADPADLARQRAEYGLGDPVLLQYTRHLGGAVRGDFGVSFATGKPVGALIGSALPNTVALTSTALVLAILAGSAIAVAATYRPGHRLANLLLSMPPLAISVPTFWIGLMLIQLLSFRVPVFPAFGANGVRGLILPAVTLAVPTAALLAQVLAKSLSTTLSEPYIQAVRARGASPARIHLRHALRNAALPALTVVGLLVGGLLANSVLIETVFSRNGLGRVIVDAVTVQDTPVVLGVVVFSAAAFVVVNLAVDLVYPLLDPRVVVAASGRPR